MRKQNSDTGEESVTELSQDSFWPFLLRYSEPCNLFIIKKNSTDFILNFHGGGQLVGDRSL